MMAWVWAKYVKDTGLSPFVSYRPPFFTTKFFAYYGTSGIFDHSGIMIRVRITGAVWVTVSAIMRPLRAVIAAVISPYFNKIIDVLQNRLRLPKPVVTPISMVTYLHIFASHTNEQAVLAVIVLFNIVITIGWLLANLKIAFYVLQVPPLLAAA